MRKPAKIATHAGVVIRFDKGAGTFSADGFDGETWKTLEAVHKAIETSTASTLDIPAYRAAGYGAEDLEEVTIIGIRQPKGYRVPVLSIVDARGDLRTGNNGELFPRTPEVLAAWQRSKALEAEAERLNERSRAIEEAIPRIVNVDERLARARDRE